jgi:hypothetical protein
MTNKKIVKAEENSDSHYIQNEDKYGNPINIPVVYASDGIAERLLAQQMVKSQNTSKYISYNDYHKSPKNK